MAAGMILLKRKFPIVTIIMVGFIFAIMICYKFENRNLAFLLKLCVMFYEIIYFRKFATQSIAGPSDWNRKIKDKDMLTNNFILKQN